MPVADIRKTALFKAPIERVWRAISTAEGIAAWFMPNDFQPEVGGSFTIQTPFGPTPCRVLELEPPSRLLFAWGDNGWQVLIELAEVDGGTECTLVHSGWGEAEDTMPGANEKHAVIRDRMDGGWESIVLVRLREVVEAE